MNIFGAIPLDDNQCIFSVWAPEKESMMLHIVHPSDRLLKMEKNDWGYFTVTADDVSAGCRYFYMPDGETDFPDPASHFQPEGVHGYSQVVDHRSYVWNDQSWRGIPLKDMVFYELHIGTFTKEGTFEAVIPFLDDIKETGINTIEIMPVSQFPGNRNWGYDGVFPYSVQDSYGGPAGLKKLVDACHSKGIAIFLDVVYNHLGPEGNYLAKFGPYFTEKYRTPWGAAINLDDEWCDGVKEFYASNPRHWFANYHIDGLRLDAIHMVFDYGAVNFWELIYKKVRLAEQELGRRFHMIAESDTNSPKVVKVPELGGYGFDAAWLDDFHHALYVILDEKGKSRYEDFGSIQQLAKAYTEGFVHSGEFVRFRKRKHGAPSVGVPGDKFVVFNHNHDQIGNRVKGERLSVLVDFDHLKLASAAILLSPYIPLFFMGEEYGEDNPFYYFVSHSDEELIEMVRKGRKKEFEAFKWQAQPPDPQAESTFASSRIDWNKRNSGQHKVLLEWNKALLALRKSNNAIRNMEKNDIHANTNSERGLLLHRRSSDETEHVICFFNFSESDMTFHVPSFSEKWVKLIDSKDASWMEHRTTGPKNSPSPPEIIAQQKLKTSCYSVVVYGSKVI
jgi:maltooligosyltrehalose trehalohydrolase